MSDNETHDDGLNVRLAKWLGWTNFTEDSGMWGTPPGKPAHHFEIVPDYEGDLNEGMVAVVATGTPNPQVVLMYERNLDGTGRWYADVNFYDSPEVYKGYGATPQEALARALDAMRQQQEAGDE